MKEEKDLIGSLWAWHNGDLLFVLNVHINTHAAERYPKERWYDYTCALPDACGNPKKKLLCLRSNKEFIRTLKSTGWKRIA